MSLATVIGGILLTASGAGVAFGAGIGLLVLGLLLVGLGMLVELSA